MDEATVDLIIALQMHDLELLMSSWKGKSVEGSVMTDDQLTVDLQQAELQKQESMLADIRMARSISRAVQDDGITVAILMAEERRSAQDREMACRMSGKPYSDVSNVPDCSVDEDILSRFGRLNIRQAKDENENKDERDGQSCYGESVFSFNEVETGESSSWAAGQETGKSKGKGKFKNECVACNEVRDTVQVPCQHQYCKICVVQIVGDSIMDESLFPPRCCGHEMPMSLIRPYLPFELIVQFQQTAIEFGTPNHAAAVTASATDAARNGKPAPASFTMRKCSSYAREISYTETPDPEPPRQQQTWWSRLWPICGSATTAIMEDGG